MPDCLISFGSNLGDRASHLSEVVRRLQEMAGVQRVRVSQPLETLPVGGPAGQDPYLNAALRFKTTWSAAELHQRLLGVEAGLGRVRRERWGSRTADLDLLLYDQQQIESDALTIPHPRMACRRFVVQPAAEIASDMQHPGCGCSVKELLECLNGRPNRILVASDRPRPGAHWFNQLAKSLADKQVQLVGVDSDEVVELGPDQWQLIWLGAAKAFRSRQPAKLLVLLHGPPGAGQPMDFEGPRLRLPDLEPAALQLELRAAIEGMQPLSLHRR